MLLDLSDTRKRTEAAHVYYWFARLALVFGPLAGVMLPLYHGAEAFSAVAVGLQVCAFLLLSGLRVPFRAPLEPSLFTFDRFWLPRGFRLFVPLFGVCLVAGLLMGRHCGAGFCVFLGVGFWLALWLHRCVFRERLQRELACGFCSLVVAALLLSCPLADERWLWVVAVFLGCGLGWTTSRYLLSYIRTIREVLPYLREQGGGRFRGGHACRPPRRQRHDVLFLPRRDAALKGRQDGKVPGVSRKSRENRRTL